MVHRKELRDFIAWCTHTDNTPSCGTDRPTHTTDGKTLQQEGKGIRFAALEMVVWLLTFWEGGMAKHKKSITLTKKARKMKKKKKMCCSYAVDAGGGGEGLRWWGKGEERGHPGGERKEINFVSVAAYAFGFSPGWVGFVTGNGLIAINKNPPLGTGTGLGWSGNGNVIGAKISHVVCCKDNC